MNIKDLLTENQIIFNLKSRDKKSLIEELTDVLDKNGRLLDKETYIKAVFKREEEFSTGIGNGIAIPHGKSEGVKIPSLAFGISRDGIDYDSFDGEKVHIVFLIAVPNSSDNTHLKILSSLSRKLMHKEVTDALINADSYEQVINAIGE